MHVRSPEHLEERLLRLLVTSPTEVCVCVCVCVWQGVRAHRRDADGAQREERGRRHEERTHKTSRKRCSRPERRRLVLVDRGEEPTTALVVFARVPNRESIVTTTHTHRQRERERALCVEPCLLGRSACVQSSRGKNTRRENLSRGKNEEEKKHANTGERRRRLSVTLVHTQTQYKAVVVPRPRNVGLRLLL